MTATYSTQKALARSKRLMSDFDPDATTSTLVNLVAPSTKGIAIAQYRRFVFGIMRTVGTGAISTVKVQAATAADGTGATDVISATPTTADAVGDTVWYEVDVEQIREVLPTATHVCLAIALATATDECCVFSESLEPTFPARDLTAAYIS
jgi:hypothetical protein